MWNKESLAVDIAVLHDTMTMSLGFWVIQERCPVSQQYLLVGASDIICSLVGFYI